jgi:methylthioribose-1-phosphate isomerase
VPGFVSTARGLAPERIIRLEDDRVVCLDQRRLPDAEVDLECRSSADVAEAIRALAVRGAPLIGVAAAYGYALAAAQGEDLAEAAKELGATRPTAVNLAWALREMRAAGTDPAALAERARAIHRDEVTRCRAMAEHTLAFFDPGSRPLTHCNTGGLATGGVGTALGAIVLAWERGLVDTVLVDETRPVLQGARLTAWELHAAGVPFSLIADAAAPGLIARREATHVFVGADRIAANGDTANKVGTYPLALAAAGAGVPFVVVAPSTSVDLATAAGADIPIEERPAEEVSDRYEARNPAFDVTPAHLITAIVTEAGVNRPPFAESLRHRREAAA